jgi:tetratricopeptide (TPR) repeat protein
MPDSFEEISNQMRCKGNEYFKKGEFLQAYFEYLTSAAAAPKPGPVRAMAFANRCVIIAITCLLIYRCYLIRIKYNILFNRSAALYNMRRYEDCLVDIENAIANDYDSKKIYKILLRKTRCMQLLGKNYVKELQETLKVLISVFLSLQM